MSARATTGRDARGGRPSKGRRRPLMSRVPEELADKVTQQAESCGLSNSDFIAAVLAEKVGFELHLATLARPATSVQEEIAMASAS